MTDQELGLLLALVGVGGVVLGGLVAGGFALLTGWLESRREQRRWVREQRMAAYLQLAVVLDRMPTSPEGWKKAGGYSSQVRDAMAPMTLVATTEILYWGTKLMADTLAFTQASYEDKMFTKDGISKAFIDALEDYSAAKTGYTNAVQKALGFGRSERFRVKPNMEKPPAL